MSLGFPCQEYIKLAWVSQGYLFLFSLDPRKILILQVQILKILISKSLGNRRLGDDGSDLTA